MKKIVVLLAAMLMVLIPTAASAHVAKVRQGQDVARVNSFHTGVKFKDRECDGNFSFAQYKYMSPSGPAFGTLYDRNGCNDGASRAYVSGQIVSLRVCEVKRGIFDCTPFKRI